MQSQMVTFQVPKPLLSSFDKQLQKNYQTRSEFFRQAMLSFIKDQREWDELRVYSRKQAKKLGIKTQADVQKLIDDYREGK